MWLSHGFLSLPSANTALVSRLGSAPRIRPGDGLCGGEISSLAVAHGKVGINEEEETSNMAT